MNPALAVVCAVLPALNDKAAVVSAVFAWVNAPFAWSKALLAVFLDAVINALLNVIEIVFAWLYAFCASTFALFAWLKAASAEIFALLAVVFPVFAWSKAACARTFAEFALSKPAWSYVVLAKPVIAVLLIELILPFASTVNTGTKIELPWEPVLTTVMKVLSVFALSNACCARTLALFALSNAPFACKNAAVTVAAPNVLAASYACWARTLALFALSKAPLAWPKAEVAYVEFAKPIIAIFDALMTRPFAAKLNDATEIESP